MRIWDIPPDKLCRNHLLGEHSELHAIWVILTKGKNGFSNHPETLRWRNKLKALYLKHEIIVKEMKKRGFNHYSFLEKNMADGLDIQNEYVDSIQEQIKLLRKKNCDCKV